MMDPDERKRAPLEPNFNELAEQEEGHSLRLKIVFGVMFGPAIVLGLLGYYDAAVKAFLFCLGGGFLYLRIMAKLDAMDL